MARRNLNKAATLLLEDERKKIIARQNKKRQTRKPIDKESVALISGQQNKDDRSGRTDRQLSKITGIGHDTVSKFNYIQKHAEDFDEGDLIRQMCEETVDDEIKHRRNLSDKAKIKGVLLLQGFYKEKAKENQKSTQFKEISTVCSELNTPSTETDKESQDRRNKNRVNSKLADIADVSTAKVFRYKEIL